MRQTSSGGVHNVRFNASVPKLVYTTAVINRHVRHARDMRVSRGVLARSGSMIPSLKILDHANTQLLLLSPTRCVRNFPMGDVTKEKCAIVQFFYYLQYQAGFFIGGTRK